MRVQRQLQRPYAGPVRFTEPKSKQARRALNLPALVIDALRAHRKEQAKERLAAGESWEGQDLVFTTLRGRPLHSRWLVRDFHLLLQSAGLRRIRFHDLRHSCATALLVEAVPPRVVMEILGHSEIRLTMETYSHVIPSLRREAADSMDKVLRRAAK